MPTIDPHASREATRALILRRRPIPALLSTFFNADNPVFHMTKQIELDFLETALELAQFAHPDVRAKPSEREGYVTRQFTPAYIKEKLPLKSSDAFNRLPGEALYNSRSAADRAAEMEMQDINTIDDKIIRTLEFMAAKALTTGVIPVVGEGVNENIDFGMKASHKPVLSGGALWSAPTTCTPIDDIENWAGLVADDGDETANRLFLGATSAQHFRAADQVQTYLDNLRINVGEVRPGMVVPRGTRYIATIFGIDIFTYAGKYLPNGSTTKTPYIPDDGALMGSTDAYSQLHYGPIQHFDSLIPEERFVKILVDEELGQKSTLVETNALTAPHNIDAFVYADTH